MKKQPAEGKSAGRFLHIGCILACFGIRAGFVLEFAPRQQTGTNFFTYVENVRIDKAKELLSQTNLKISDISTQVGYASVNSFCRAFKRSTGNNATNFRNGTDL